MHVFSNRFNAPPLVKMASAYCCRCLQTTNSTPPSHRFKVGGVLVSEDPGDLPDPNFGAVGMLPVAMYPDQYGVCVFLWIRISASLHVGVLRAA